MREIFDAWRSRSPHYDESHEWDRARRPPLHRSRSRRRTSTRGSARARCPGNFTGAPARPPCSVSGCRKS